MVFINLNCLDYIKITLILQLLEAKHFWEAWEQVSSVPETIYVTDRPDFESFEIIIKPPKYSKLPRRIQEGNLSSIETLKGSQIDINLESNRILGISQY